MAKQKGNCAFCPFTGRLSKEHIWAEWLRPHLPRAFALNRHTTSVSTMTEEGELLGHRATPGLLDKRSGDPRAQTLRVVCEACNNKWMSLLQSKSKPVLTTLINGDWPALGPDERTILAAWCTMFTMVVEHADPRTLTSTFAERAELRAERHPPPNWTVWIGRSLPGDIWNGAWNHFGGGARGYLDPNTGVTHRIARNDTQSTAAIVNCLYFQTFSTTSEARKLDAEAFALRHGLAVLWPMGTASPASLARPQTVLDRFAADSASRFLAHPGMPIRYAWEV